MWEVGLNLVIEEAKFWQQILELLAHCFELSCSINIVWWFWLKLSQSMDDAMLKNWIVIGWNWALPPSFFTCIPWIKWHWCYQFELFILLSPDVVALFNSKAASFFNRLRQFVRHFLLTFVMGHVQTVETSVSLQDKKRFKFQYPPNKQIILKLS